MAYLGFEPRAAGDKGWKAQTGPLSNLLIFLAPALSTILWCRQCDQTFGIKSCQNFPKIAPKGPTAVFTLKLCFFKIATKVTKYFGCLSNLICRQEL